MKVRSLFFNRIGFVVTLLVSIIILSFGCGAGKQATDQPSSVSQGDIESAQEISELNSRLLLQGVSTPVSPADYLIGPADLLEIKVFESERLTTTARVSSRGEITLPLIGSVPVADLSAREAEEKIEGLLKDGGFINSPHVSVFISEYKSKLVSVVGLVREPGSYELLGRQTVMDALAAAKGLQGNAGRTAYITRVGENGSRQAFLLDLEELLQQGNSETNIALKPGDVIYVPESGNIFIEGAARKTGSFPIREGYTTVSQSIAMAGGLASYADGGDVRLVRYLGNGKREVVELDLGKIQKGEAEDPVVKDRDAIIVGASSLKKFFYGLSVSLGFGLVGVGYSPPEK